ncbi:hypothetical protein HK405_013625, partial [Cladochytrium tenue]
MARGKQPPHQSRPQQSSLTTSSSSTSAADTPSTSSILATTSTDTASSSSSDTGSSSASSAANTDTTASSSTTTTGSATSTTSMANSGMATATMLPYISADGSCLFLDGNTPCGADFEGYPVALDGLEYSFADYTGFVQLVGNLTDSTTVAASLASQYGCTAGAALESAVAGLRYRASYYCTELVYESISLGICQSPLASSTSASSVSSSSSTSAAAVYTDGPILCASTCSLAESTLSSVILNSTLCSNTTAATAAVNNTATYCKTESALAASGSCLSSVKLETSTCGFSTQTDATAGCPSIAATDTCCAALLASSTSSTSANSSSTSGPNLAVVAGSAVAGVLVVLAVTIAAAFLLRSRFNGRKASAASDTASGGAAASTAAFSYQPLGDQRPPSAAASHVSFNAVTSPSPSAMIVPTPTAAPFVAAAGSSVTRNRGPLPVPARNTQLSGYSTAAASSFSAGAAVAPGTMLRVRFPYSPTLPDELPLQAGRDVLLLYAFDDGWALGLDPASRRQGTFPMACCAAGDSLDRPVSTATGTVLSDSLASWESLTAGVHPPPPPNLARRASSVSASVRSTASDIARSYLRSSGYDVDFDDHTD